MLLALVMVATASGCGRPIDQPVPVTYSGKTMGTHYRVTVYGLEPGKQASVGIEIDKSLASLNSLVSTYDPESELSRFNTSESTEWYDVSPATAEIVDYALGVAADSAGSFDPTIGPLVNLWGFGPGENRSSPPSDDEIAEARRSVGYEKVESRLVEPSLRKFSPGVYVDLSAVAKGHGVDLICELLVNAGAEACMVEIGGEVRTHGAKPGGGLWRIGVERVDNRPVISSDQPRTLQQIVEMSDLAIATSGDYRNFFEHEGLRYSHTIDPTTGRPVTHTLSTVTVAAETCREADALATALLVMGPDAGYDWAVERGVAALLVRRMQDYQLAERVTPAWNEAFPSQEVQETAP